MASNWGKNKHADWYLNLKKTPQASLEIKGRLIPLLARQALGDEYAALWKFATGRHPPYLDYQEMTSRPIPLMLFEPFK